MAGEVFISYRRTDLAIARRLHDLLQMQGIDAWYDAQIGAGQDWRAATAAALSGSRVFILLFSKEAAASEDIAKELAAATLSRKLVVPVRLQNIQPEGAFLYELASKNWIDAYEDTDARLAELAKTLADVVKKGVSGASVVQFERGVISPIRRARPWRAMALTAGGLIAAGWLLALAVGMIAAAAPVPGRVALFSIDAESGDKDAVAAAAATSNDILTIFAALQRDVVASSDTQGVPPRERLDRALQLRAQYVISGSATRLGDLISLSVRLEDTLSRTAIWTPEPIAGIASRPASPAAQTAAFLNDRLTCIINVRASLRTDDMRIVTRLPKACGNIRNSEFGSEDGWSELAELAPGSAWVRANQAISLLAAIDRGAPAAAGELKRRAVEALRKAEELDPALAEVQTARLAMAQSDGASLLEQEKIIERGLALAPNGPHLNGGYGAWLHRVGRAREALPYARKALQLDPLSPPKLLGVPYTFVRGGDVAGAEHWLQQRHDLFPDESEWQLRVLLALFRGVGNVDDVMRDPPLQADRQTTECLERIVALVRKATLQAKKEAALRAATCSGSGLEPVRAAEIRVFLGDYGWILDSPDYAQGSTPFLFDPVLSELRKDARFLPLMRSIGLVDYWRDSRHPPDFCATEKSPVCDAIAAK